MSGLHNNITSAIDRFELNLSSMSFEEAYDQLAQEVMNIRFTNIRTMIASGKVMSKEDGELGRAVQNEFDEIDKVYHKLKKSGRLGEIKQNEKFGDQVLDIVKKKKSVIGEIVRMTPRDQKE